MPCLETGSNSRPADTSEFWKNSSFGVTSLKISSVTLYSSMAGPSVTPPRIRTFPSGKLHALCLNLVCDKLLIIDHSLVFISNIQLSERPWCGAFLPPISSSWLFLEIVVKVWHILATGTSLLLTSIFFMSILS